jgi:hypothetical protein
MGSHLNL